MQLGLDLNKLKERNSDHQQSFEDYDEENGQDS